MMTSNTNLNTKTQGFKKKTSALNTDLGNVKPADKLSDLKSKLQKQKQMMKKTGKRFREDNSISTQQISISTDKDITVLANQNHNLNKHDISIGQQQPVKQTISLKDISISDKSAKKQSMMASQLFQKQVKQQKKRSKEVYEFLKKIELESFAQSLINIGFDELETLTDLTTEDLNLVMMRAHQQIRLLQAVKSLNPKSDDKPKLTNRQQFNNSSTLWRVKTQPIQYPSGSKTSRVKSSQILARLKTEQGKQEQPSALKPGSFLYTVGARNWSVEDQVRRACSVCFKVQQQMQKKGQCFYCSNCYKYVSEDLLQISLGKSMNKEYLKYQKE